MKKNKSIISLIGFLYFISGFVYYYFGNTIPFETTSKWLQLIIISLYLISPILISLFIAHILNDKLQENQFLGCTIPILMFILFGHNLVWSFIKLMQKGYEDIKIEYPESNNKNHKIIYQYKDEGALGSHNRLIEVYEFTPFVRYIYRIEYL